MVQAEQGWVWADQVWSTIERLPNSTSERLVTGQMGKCRNADCCFHPGLDQKLWNITRIRSPTRKQKSDFVAGPPPVLTVASTMSLRKLLSCYRLEAGWECMGV